MTASSSAWLDAGRSGSGDTGSLDDVLGRGRARRQGRVRRTPEPTGHAGVDRRTVVEPDLDVDQLDPVGAWRPPG